MSKREWHTDPESGRQYTFMPEEELQTFARFDWGRTVRSMLIGAMLGVLFAEALMRWGS